MKLFLVPSPTGAGSALHVWLDDDRQWQGAGEPLNLGSFADAAYSRIRQEYPLFAYRFACESGLLNLPGWSGRIAAYWLIPFSEKNPLRTRLINHLYRLLLVEDAIREHQPTDLIATSNDERLVRLFLDLGRKYGLSVTRVCSVDATAVRKSSFRRYLKRAKSIVDFALRVGRRRFALVTSQWAIWRWLRGQAETTMAAVTHSGRPLVAFYSRYPILWENPGEEQVRERNFGTFPEFLQALGFDVVYPCVLSLSVSDLRVRLPEILVQAQRLGLVFLESLLSFSEFFRAYLNISQVWRYLRWRQRQSSEKCPIYFQGVDVKALVLRDLDDDFLFDSELPNNSVRAYALQRFCQIYSPRVVCHPFEFQPMERAVYAGVKAGAPETTIVGVEPCVFFSGWLSFVYAPGEVAARQGPPPWDRAPLPDYLAAYGTLFHETLSSRCDRNRLLLTGAIRYSDIQGKTQDPLVDVDGANGHRLLVIGSPFRKETIRLFEVAASLSNVYPEVFILLKFHYHAPLIDEWERLAHQSGCTRYKIFHDDLIPLLQVSTATLLGSTSVVAEAIAMGCMPIVFHEGDEYTFCPALDIREAIFLCRDTDSVVDAVGACIRRTQTYWERRRAWPIALEKMFYRLDGRQNERLFAELSSRSVL